MSCKTLFWYSFYCEDRRADFLIFPLNFSLDSKIRSALWFQYLIVQYCKGVTAIVLVYFLRWYWVKVKMAGFCKKLYTFLWPVFFVCVWYLTFSPIFMMCVFKCYFIYFVKWDRVIKKVDRRDQYLFTFFGISFILLWDFMTVTKGN